MKRLGISKGKDGLLIENKRLADIRRFQRDTKKELPKEKAVKLDAVIKQGTNKQDEVRGVY